VVNAKDLAKYDDLLRTLSKIYWYDTTTIMSLSEDVRRRNVKDTSKGVCGEAILDAVHDYNIKYGKPDMHIASTLHKRSTSTTTATRQDTWAFSAKTGLAEVVRTVWRV